jgi:hypothetical protein
MMEEEKIEITTWEEEVTYFDIIAWVALRRRSKPPAFAALSVPVMAALLGGSGAIKAA